MTEYGFQIENTIGHHPFASNQGRTADFAAFQRNMMARGIQEK